MARLRRLAALRLLIGGCAALVPPSATNQYAPGSTRHQRAPASTLPQRAPRRRRRIATYASPDIEDRLALGGDVAVLFLYSYTQKSLDTIYAVTANYVEGIEVDEMDCFRDPSFAAAALSLAWLCGALPQGAFRFDVTRGGVNNALTTVAKCGCLSVAAVVLLLSIRAAAAGVPLSPQDAGFAAGILPIVGAWRYVLADTSAKL